MSLRDGRACDVRDGQAIATSPSCQARAYSGFDSVHSSSLVGWALCFCSPAALPWDCTPRAHLSPLVRVCQSILGNRSSPVFVTVTSLDRQTSILAPAWGAALYSHLQSDPPFPEVSSAVQPRLLDAEGLLRHCWLSNGRSRDDAMALPHPIVLPHGAPNPRKLPRHAYHRVPRLSRLWFGVNDPRRQWTPTQSQFYWRFLLQGEDVKGCHLQDIRQACGNARSGDRYSCSYISSQQQIFVFFVFSSFG
jgi:hypothetical protein